MCSVLCSGTRGLKLLATAFEILYKKSYKNTSLMCPVLYSGTRGLKLLAIAL